MKLFSNSQEKGRGVLGVEMHIRLFGSDNHSLCETFFVHIHEFFELVSHCSIYPLPSETSKR
jgi:hypothetical protein